MSAIPELIKGYVRIRLCSRDPERFLNLCAANQIFLWELLYTEKGYEMNLSVRDFFRLQPLCRKSGSRIALLERHGLPFFFIKTRKRKAFFLGAAAGGILLFTLSCFIWNIHVDGNFANSTASILACLEENHIRHGILKYKISTAEISELLRKSFPNITWVSARIEGTRLILELKENVDSYQEDETETLQNGPTDLVADKDGIVTSIVTRSGTPVTTAGKVCKKGEVLVSGQLPIYNDSKEIERYDYVEADADIKIQTTYAYYDEFALDYTRLSYEPETERDWFFQVLQYRIYPGWTHAKEKNTDQYTRTFPVRLTENFYLPFYYGYTEILPYKKISDQYSEKEAELLAEDHLNQFTENLEEKGVQIIEKNVKIQITGTKCTAKGELVVNEEAVKSVPCEIMETLPRKDTAEDE